MKSASYVVRDDVLEHVRDAVDELISLDVFTDTRKGLNAFNTDMFSVMDDAISNIWIPLIAEGNT